MLIQPSITVRDTNICMFKFNHLANMCEAGYGLFLYSRDQTDVHIWLPRVDFFMGQKLNCADSSPLNPSFYLQRKKIKILLLCSTSFIVAKNVWIYSTLILFQVNDRPGREIKHTHSQENNNCFSTSSFFCRYL